MYLLQFSTSHYCRKVRLAIGLTQTPYSVENLTPGLHRLKLKPLTGATTVPVLIPDRTQPQMAIGDSSQILQYLHQCFPDVGLFPVDRALCQQVEILEDWLDESIGTATRFVYYHFRAHEGKYLDTSWLSGLVIDVVRRQYDINPAAVALAAQRLERALIFIGQAWRDRGYLVGDRLSAADLTAAALLSPLALLPSYRDRYPDVLARIVAIHQLCNEPLPPGLVTENAG